VRCRSFHEAERESGQDAGRNISETSENDDDKGDDGEGKAMNGLILLGHAHQHARHSAIAKPAQIVTACTRSTSTPTTRRRVPPLDHRRRLQPKDGDAGQ